MVSDPLIVTGAAAVVVVALMVLTAALARQLGRVSVVDTVWGLGFIAVALVSAVLGTVLRDAAYLPWLLLAMVALWGGRLAWHIGRRSHGGGEDPRYEELLSRGEGGIVRKVLLPQGLAIWFVSLPVQVAAVADRPLAWVAGLGVALWLVGLVFESVGDAQLAAYKRDPDRGPVMDRGLWRYTRHPNYFGDACVWWGIWLAVASAWPGVLTVLSPVAMSYFLVYATGARLLEKSMMRRPGYPEYAARTSMFVPLPPRRRAPAG